MWQDAAAAGCSRCCWQGALGRCCRLNKMRTKLLSPRLLLTFLSAVNHLLFSCHRKKAALELQAYGIHFQVGLGLSKRVCAICLGFIIYDNSFRWLENLPSDSQANVGSIGLAARGEMRSRQIAASQIWGVAIPAMGLLFGPHMFSSWIATSKVTGYAAVFCGCVELWCLV